MASEKPHKPSQRKLKKARAEGKTASSHIFTQSCSLVAGLMGFIGGACLVWVSNRTLLECEFEKVSLDPGVFLTMASRFIAASTGLGLISGIIAAIVANLMQVGMTISFSAVSPKWERVCPVQGVRRLLKGLASAWEGAIYLALIILALFFSFSELEQWAQFARSENFSGLNFYFLAFSWRLTVLSSLLLGCGLFDYLRKRARYFRELAMSTQEVRQEQREEEGDPGLHSFRKALHLAIANQSLIAGVRKSKVILVDGSK